MNSCNKKELRTNISNNMHKSQKIMLKEDRKQEYKPYDSIYRNCTNNMLIYSDRKQANSFPGNRGRDELRTDIKKTTTNPDVVKFHNYIGKSDQIADFKYVQFIGFQLHFNTVVKENNVP